MNLSEGSLVLVGYIITNSRKLLYEGKEILYSHSFLEQMTDVCCYFRTTVQGSERIIYLSLFDCVMGFSGVQGQFNDEKAALGKACVPSNVCVLISMTPFMTNLSQLDRPLRCKCDV